MEPTEALAYAKRIAHKMLAEPIEANSIAGSAAERAMRTYDGSIPVKRWIALCVKRQVWGHWRQKARRQECQKAETWWVEAVFVTPSDQLEGVAQADLQLLTEYYLEKWPLDVVARRYSVSIFRARKMIRGAVARLTAICEPSTSPPMRNHDESDKVVYIC